MIVYRKKGASPCCLDRAADAPFKLDQNYSLTQLDLHTLMEGIMSFSFAFMMTPIVPVKLTPSCSAIFLAL
jgi:hypothetical protein